MVCVATVEGDKISKAVGPACSFAGCSIGAVMENLLLLVNLGHQLEVGGNETGLCPSNQNINQGARCVEVATGGMCAGGAISIIVCVP